MMDAETREALEASIKHWEENAAAETPDDVSVAGKDCALCSAFFDAEACGGPCSKCPVFQKTGFHWCEESPWEEARDRFAEWDDYPSNLSIRDNWRRASRAEVYFLKSLRPTDEQEAA